MWTASVIQYDVMYVRGSAWTNGCVHVCGQVGILFRCVCVCVCVCVRACVRAYVRACVCMHMRMYI